MRDVLIGITIFICLIMILVIVISISMQHKIDKLSEVILYQSHINIIIGNFQSLARESVNEQELDTHWNNLCVELDHYRDINYFSSSDRFNDLITQIYQDAIDQCQGIYLDNYWRLNKRDSSF